jgi:hypothetical protein
MNIKDAKHNTASAAIIMAARAFLAPSIPLTNTQPHYRFYLQLLHFYQGTISEHDVLPRKPSDANDIDAELSFDTVTYRRGQLAPLRSRSGAPGAAF